MSDEIDPDQTYRIVRFYAPHMKKENETIRTGLTLQEAQDHCSDPGTSCNEWFDGFYKE